MRGGVIEACRGPPQYLERGTVLYGRPTKIMHPPLSPAQRAPKVRRSPPKDPASNTIKVALPSHRTRKDVPAMAISPAAEKTPDRRPRFPVLMVVSLAFLRARV